MEKKTILITGGLGYVGGRLSKYFAESGNYKVFSLSRTKKEIHHKEIEVFSNDTVLKKNGILSNTQIDVLIHLAAANEIVCSNQPKESNEVNINGTLNWLEWAKENGVKQFIYFSTVHVFARPLIGEYNESTPTYPNHPYSISHKSAEDYALWYHTDFDLDVRIVRLSNSFGYPAFPTADRWTLFINDICRQMTEKKQFQIHSNVLQERDFISLSNVCSAVECLINYQVPESDNRIFNISNEKTQSLWEISNQIKKVAKNYFKTEIDIVYHPEKSEKTKKLKISNQKLKKIGWQNKEGYFEEEIIKTLQFFENKKFQ